MSGRLLRPPELLRARGEHQAGRLSTEELRRVKDWAICDVVRMQQEIRGNRRRVPPRFLPHGLLSPDRRGGKTDRTLSIQFKNEAGPVETALGAFRIGRRRAYLLTAHAELLRELPPQQGTKPRLALRRHRFYRLAEALGVTQPSWEWRRLSS